MDPMVHLLRNAGGTLINADVTPARCTHPASEFMRYSGSGAVRCTDCIAHASNTARVAPLLVVALT